MKNGVILCIDDERVILTGLQAQLDRDFGANYIIELAESGEEAIELVDELLESGNELVMAISDQMMPGIKGHEVLKYIHKVSPGTYTVLLTGQSDLEAVIDAVNEAKLYRYISKPWQSQDLVLTVKEAIKGYYQERQLAQQNLLLDKQNKELEQTVAERTKQWQEEMAKSEQLLLNILPENVAKELKDRGEATAKHYESVSILFTDFQAFTKLSSEITPQQLVETLNECYSAFDDIADAHNLEKIKTIGDAYMCAGGLPVENTSNALNAVAAAIEIQQWVANWNNKRIENGNKIWGLRIGIHTGQLIAGVIGKSKFAYDVWGDAVNIASRLESTGEPGKVNISITTYELVKNNYDCTYRGKIEVKGKGEIEMFFVDSFKPLIMHNPNSIDFARTEDFILDKLKMELPSHLYYHSIYHTLDVYNIVLLLIKEESINDYDALLLKTAALFHDSGYTVQAKEHERIACDIAKNTLPEFGYSSFDIEKICGMIMATKIPQSPKTKLEEIICDADLDYLGRDDFEVVSDNLYKELNYNRPISNEDWLKLEIDFFEEHTYFTATTRKLRNEKKAAHLKKLKNNLVNKLSK